MSPFPLSPLLLSPLRYFTFCWLHTGGRRPSPPPLSWRRRCPPLPHPQRKGLPSSKGNRRKPHGGAWERTRGFNKEAASGCDCGGYQWCCPRPCRMGKTHDRPPPRPLMVLLRREDYPVPHPSCPHHRSPSVAVFSSRRRHRAGHVLPHRPPIRHDDGGTRPKSTPVRSPPPARSWRRCGRLPSCPPRRRHRLPLRPLCGVWRSQMASAAPHRHRLSLCWGRRPHATTRPHRPLFQRRGRVLLKGGPGPLPLLVFAGGTLCRASPPPIFTTRPLPSRRPLSHRLRVVIFSRVETERRRRGTKTCRPLPPSPSPVLHPHPRRPPRPPCPVRCPPPPPPRIPPPPPHTHRESPENVNAVSGESVTKAFNSIGNGQPSPRWR